MRDNGIQEAQGLGGLDGFLGLATEALGRLVLVRDLESASVTQDQLDHFLKVLEEGRAVDPSGLLEMMRLNRIDPVLAACSYAPEAARVMGERWMADQASFVQVTLSLERLHGLVRHVDSLVEAVVDVDAPSALILVAEAEQHTLGAHVLALRLRTAGFRAAVRVAPVAAELTQLVKVNSFDVALVSIGCTAGLDSGVGLVRTLKLMSRGEMCVFVGGAIPLDDAALLEQTGADRVVRDVSALIAEYDGCRQGRALDRDRKSSQRSAARSFLKGNGGDQ